MMYRFYLLIWKSMKGNLTKMDLWGWARGALTPYHLQSVADPTGGDHLTLHRLDLADGYHSTIPVGGRDTFLIPWQQLLQWKSTIFQTPSLLQWTFAFYSFPNFPLFSLKKHASLLFLGLAYGFTAQLVCPRQQFFTFLNRPIFCRQNNWQCLFLRLTLP